jgi:hypothetical protein
MIYITNTTQNNNKKLLDMKPIQIILLTLTTILLSSCELLFNLPDEEKILVCESNCYSLNMKGAVIDKTTNSGIKDIQVNLNWTKPMCIFCPDNNIYTGTTDNSGNFNISNSIDTTYFQNEFHLSLSIPKNNDYIVVPLGNDFGIYSLTESMLKNVTFELYPKAELKIITERVETDNMTTFIVEHYFCKGITYGDVINSKGNAGFGSPLNDTRITETSANIKTYIRWTKSFGNQKIEKVDSIICQKGKENIYTIRY